MATLSDLASKMRSMAAAVPIEANKLKQEIATTIAVDLVSATPVDTSKAVSNWQGSVGSPITAVRAPYASGQKGSTRSESGAAALEQMRKAIGEATPGVSIFLSNNVPYIGRLNDGHSAQIPAGFIERAVVLCRVVLRSVNFTGRIAS